MSNLKIDIILKHNYGFKWFSENGISVKGYIINERNHIIKGKELINYFSNINDKKDFEKKLNKINGQFAVILRKKEYLFVAVDLIRTFPLFYSYNDNELIISDKANCNAQNKKKNSIAIEEFLFTRYVTGNQTLLQNTYQVQAGEYLIIDKKIKSKFYHTYQTNETIKNNFNDNKNKLIKILDKVIHRLNISIDNAPIVLPLSGGYDSRLLAVLLKKNNINNVICYTYGNRNSEEVLISEKVAKQLGFKWMHIEPHKEINNPEYIFSEEFNKYIDYAFNYVSQPHFKEFFIVKELKEKGLIPENSLFIPGHSGDMLAGSRLLKLDDKKISIDQFTKRLIKTHYILRAKKIDSTITKKLKTYYNPQMQTYSLIHNFDLKERQAKYIVNSLRIYEFFGYKHRIPLWDKELVDFFKNLNFKYKINNNFYNKVVSESLFIPFEVNFVPKIKKQRNEKVKRILKSYIPNYFIRAGKKITPKKNNQNILYSTLLEMQKTAKTKYITNNNIITEWIIKTKFENS